MRVQIERTRQVADRRFWGGLRPYTTVNYGSVDRFNKSCNLRLRATTHHRDQSHHRTSTCRPVPGCRHFQYRALPPTSSPSGLPFIRLLELLPGTETDPINSILTEVELSQNLVYEAVSYCWGDPDDGAIITCNEQDLIVPKNLAVAFRNMRRLDEPRRLWADALCINQADVVEKERQVQLIWAIFSHAQRTLVWLGDVQDKSHRDMSKLGQHAIKLGLSVFRLRDDSPQSPRVRVWDAIRKEYRTLLPFSAEFYLDLIGMLQMPWFRRAWVVQEVAVANKVAVFWGSSEYDWEELLQALRYMAGTRVPLAFITTLQDISSIEEERTRYRLGNTSLYAVLLRHQRCLATDTRDKVFSFHGLAERFSQPQTPIRISYRDGISAVYRNTSLNILQRDQTLDLLSRPPHQLTSSLKDLPSWVPDWSISPNTSLAYSWGHGPLSLAGAEIETGGVQRQFSATLNSKYLLTTHEDMLVVEGYQFDQVVEVGPIFQGVQLPYTVQSFTGIIREWIRTVRAFLHARKVILSWQSMAQIRSKIRYTTNETRREAFWQTISVGEYNRSARVQAELRVWSNVTRLAIFVRQMYTDPLGLPYCVAVFLWHLVSNKELFVFEIQGRYTLNRRLIRTARGYLGLASCLTDVGDDVVLCKGSSVPLVLRKTDDTAETFRLVGDSYVHGIMDGRTFEERRCRQLFLT
ncbi:hypothetical protein GP486_000847 [Trichoglossum hirsutum]|uniref:Heterokaryon incompatibility domain-containing protein n=1 Tax=Trichoglossum hirsutum TaxID=265104 RepID=A0A9P8LH15_9PEZI|nr:hypothetical protein GP486_000847 [Trichoglossum hirsutum]